MTVTRETEYIVIGAGSSGSVVANRLSVGHEVVLLEAGGDSRSLLYRMPLAATKLWLNPKSSWGLWSEPEPGLSGRRLPVPRGKALGGSSAINGTVYNRGSPHDYDRWRDMGLAGWGYADLLPYFRRIEDHWRGADAVHGSGGEVRISPMRAPSPFLGPLLEAARQMGLATTDDPLVEAEGIGLSDFNVDARGRRVSAADAFLWPIRRRATLTIERRAHVQQIVIERNRAVAVVYRQGTETHVLRARREIVLSAGAIGSPHILLLSGIGPADELAALGIAPVHDLPEVGRGFNDQVAGSFEFLAKLPHSFVRHLRADRFAFAIGRWMLGLGGPVAAPPVVAMGALRTDQAGRSPDLRMMLAAGTMQARMWYPGFSKPQPHTLLMNVAVAHPASRGSITLAGADPLAPPRIRFNLLTDPDDMAKLKSYYRLMRELIRQPAFAAIAGEITRPTPEPADDAGLETYLRSVAGTTSHPVGSCRMGVDAAAVVDGDARVYGIEGLRVVDASIFPTQISGNPHATVMMAGDRVSDMILGRHPLPAATL